MSADDFALMTAIQIELDAGLPCGECGLPHAISPDDFDRGHARLCSCLACCFRYSFMHMVAQYPDIKPERHGSEIVITNRLFLDVMRRVDRDIEELERRSVAGSDAPQGLGTFSSNPT